VIVVFFNRVIDRHLHFFLYPTGQVSTIIFTFRLRPLALFNRRLAMLDLFDDELQSIFDCGFFFLADQIECLCLLVILILVSIARLLVLEEDISQILRSLNDLLHRLLGATGLLLKG